MVGAGVAFAPVAPSLVAFSVPPRMARPAFVVNKASFNVAPLGALAFTKMGKALPLEKEVEM